MSVAIIPGMSGPGEMVLIFLVILLLFGGAKLPSLARALGKSLSEFKKGKQEGDKDIKEMETSTGELEKGEPKGEASPEGDKTDADKS